MEEALGMVAVRACRPQCILAKHASASLIPFGCLLATAQATLKLPGADLESEKEEPLFPPEIHQETLPYWA